jgi:hypothetical protein
MAKLLIDQHNAAQDATFQKRVYMAMLKAAQDIRSEATTVPNHTKRIVFGQNVVSAAPGQYQNNALLVAWASAVAAQGIDNTATDVQIASTIAAIWDAWAG